METFRSSPNLPIRSKKKLKKGSLRQYYHIPWPQDTPGKLFEPKKSFPSPRFQFGKCPPHGGCWSAGMPSSRHLHSVGSGDSCDSGPGYLGVEPELTVLRPGPRHPRRLPPHAASLPLQALRLLGRALYRPAHTRQQNIRRVDTKVFTHSARPAYAFSPLHDISAYPALRSQLYREKP